MKRFSIFGKKPSPKIFICYRRGGEGAGFGGRIADKLVDHFGGDQCFRDVEDIEKGTDFVESLKHATSICELLIAVIGPDWLTLKDEHGNVKIQDKNDFVRLEVSTALARNIRLIPVLVGGAKIPSEDQLSPDLKALVRRQSHELTDHRWDYDSRELIKAIESMGIKGLSPEEREARKRKKKIVAAVALTALVLLLSAGIGFGLTRDRDTGDKPNSTINGPVRTTNLIEDNLKENMKVINSAKTPKETYVREKASVKNAIILGSNLEIEAFRTLDENKLSKVYSGDVLRSASATVDQFRTLGVYQLNNLESQSFGNIKVYKENNRLLAEAELFETWSNHTHRISDNLCLLHQEPHYTPQTLYLEQRNDIWYITSVAHHSTAVPITTQCGQYE